MTRRFNVGRTSDGDEGVVGGDDDDSEVGDDDDDKDDGGGAPPRIISTHLSGSAEHATQGLYISLGINGSRNSRSQSLSNDANTWGSSIPSSV